MKNTFNPMPPPDKMVSDCAALHYDLKHADALKLDAFAKILQARTNSANLTGPFESGRIWERHILESIAYIPLLDRNCSVVDIGTGAGFPGLILAILGVEATLLEPRRKRRLFLSHAVGILGLEGIIISPQRVEDARPFPAHTQFTARAVFPPERLLSMINKGGTPEYTLVCRQPPGMMPEKGRRAVPLPCPPLDREGFMVQYHACPGDIAESHPPFYKHGKDA